MKASVPMPARGGGGGDPAQGGPGPRVGGVEIAMKALYAGYGAVLGIWRYKLGCGAVLVNTALCWCKGRCVGVHGVQGAVFGDIHLCGGRIGPGGLARICPPRDDGGSMTRNGQGADRAGPGRIEPGAGG